MSPEKLPKLTTTSFALLGLLRRRPWSAYELTGFMRKSILRAIWPRAESHLYSEPKLLLKRGYVAAREEHNGARKRTVYSITPEGEAALVCWLREERATEFRFEYELLVRFAFAESVDLEQVLAYLDQTREEALQDARVGRAGVDAILEDGDWRVNPGAPYAGAIMHLVANQLEARLAWVDETRKRFLALEDTAGLPELAQNFYQEASERLSVLLEED